MLIAERFVLLALDPQSGRIVLPHPDTRADTLCAAGLLVDLFAQKRLSFDAARRLAVDTTLPSQHAILNDALNALAAIPRASAAEAILQVERRLAPLDRHLLDALYRRDVLHRVRDWQFWRRDALRYPLRSLQARNDTASFLLQAADGGGGAAGIGLLMLADVAGVMTAHLGARHHERANRMLLALNAIDATHELAGIAAIRSALLA